MPSVAFALQERARLLLVPPSWADGTDDAAGFALCCGLVSCHRLHAVSSLRFDAGISLDAGSQLPGTLASPRAGLHPLADLILSPGYVTSWDFPTFRARAPSHVVKATEDKATELAARLEKIGAHLGADEGTKVSP